MFHHPLGTGSTLSVGRARVRPELSWPDPALTGSRAKSDDLTQPGLTQGQPDPILFESMDRVYNKKKNFHQR